MSVIKLAFVLLSVACVSVGRTGRRDVTRRRNRPRLNIIEGDGGCRRQMFIDVLCRPLELMNYDLCADVEECIMGQDFGKFFSLITAIFQVIVGDVSKDTEESSQQTIQLSKIKRHEDYDSYSMENDIALLKLSKAISFDSNVDKIAICTTQMAPDSGSCTAAGWGYTSETGTYSTVLQKVTLPIVSWETCSRNYDDADQNDFDTRLKPGMFCAGATGKDTCQGDAGGPLVCNDKLTGVASWGYGCGRANYPEVYADVCYNSGWIQSNAV
ncbi:unnamed protein product, partial [Meganyctiphanes norvegica]